MAVTLLPKDTYLAMIRNSVGSNLFRNLYGEVDGQKTDILRDGDLSCAFFVSSILHHFQFINLPHATVAGTERDLQDSGWMITASPKEGDVLIWDSAVQAGGEEHPHIGFYIGNYEAISNSDREKTPVLHHSTFGQSNGIPVRKITAMYTHPALA